MEAAKIADSSKKDGLTTQFKVVMQDFEEIVFSSCDGLEAEVDVVYIAEGGRANSARAVRGTPRPSKITFSKGAVANKKGGKKNLFDWFQDVCDSSKALKRQQLTIQILDTNKKVVQTWRVNDAWPCRWVGPLLDKESTELTVEYVSFAHEGITT